MMVGIGLGVPRIGGLANAYYAARWGVVSYWKLDEASGTRSDSVGSNHLTSNNSVGQAAAKVGAASAQFVAASSQSLSIADNVSLSTGDLDFWTAGWVYLDSSSGTYRSIAGKWAVNEQEYSLTKSDTNTAQFVVSATGTTSVLVDAGALATGQWHFLISYHDSVSNVIAISKNGGAFVTTNHSAGVRDGASPFRIGATGFGDFMDGRIDAVAFGKTPPLGIAALATEIRDRLYNGGAGREQPWR